MARMDVEDLSPHRQMILIGQPVNMVLTNMTHVWTYIPTKHWAVIIHSLPATVCPVPPPPPPGGQRQVIKTTFSRIWRFLSEGFIHCGAGGAQEELFAGQRGEHVEVFLVPGWQAHNWMMEWSSSMISLSFCWALTYFRRASLWRLRVTGRRS